MKQKRNLNDIKLLFQKIWKFANENIGYGNKFTLSPYKGINIDITYDTIFDCGYFEIADLDYEINFNNDVKDFVKAFDLDDDFCMNDIDPEDEVIDKIQLNDLQNEWNNLKDEVESYIDFDNYSFDSEFFDNLNETTWSNFNEFWAAAKKEFGFTSESAKALPRVKIIKISDEYNAEVFRDSNIIRVGCQRVPVQNVRDLLAIYDELNPA